MADVDLPEPDSPTMATHWPGYTLNEESRTACTARPSSVVKSTCRSLTSSSGPSARCSWSSLSSIFVCSLICITSRSSRRTALGIKGVFDGVAHHDERQHGDCQCHRRVEQHHRVGTQDRLRVRDVAAPADRRGRQADAQEAQCGFGDDVRAERRGGDDDDRRQRVGQDVAEQVAHRGGAQRGRGRVEFEVLRREHGAAGDARGGDPAEEREHEHDLPNRGDGAEHLQHHNRAEQHRDGHEDVDDAAEHSVDPAAAETGDRSDERADRHDDERGENADAQRRARAVDDACVHVAALHVKSEGMARARGFKRIVERAVVRVGLREDAREERHEDDEHDEDRRDDEQRVPAQRAPCVGPHACGRSGFVDRVHRLQRRLFERGNVTLLPRKRCIDVCHVQYPFTHAYLMRGSSAAYSMSTSRLHTTNTSVSSVTTETTMLASPLRMLW